MDRGEQTANLVCSSRMARPSAGRIRPAANAGTTERAPAPSVHAQPAPRGWLVPQGQRCLTNGRGSGAQAGAVQDLVERVGRCCGSGDGAGRREEGYDQL